MKKIFITFLCAIMVMVFMPTMVFAADAGGSGTQEDPYIILTEDDFAKLNQSSEYIYAELGADITLNQDGNTIGIFNGELNGNGYTITNNKTGALVGTFVSGKLYNYTWDLDVFSNMVYEQYRAGQSHVYEDITVTGEVSLTANNNNESPILTYADGDTTMRNVTIDMDFSSPTYNGLFIGYEPVRNSDYVFENCKVKGTYIGSDLGVIFGNGSMRTDASDYGLQHLLGVNGAEKTATLTITDLDLTEASIVGLKTVPHLLCGVSYNAEKMEALETELATNVSGYDNMNQAESLEGYNFTLNDEGKLKIDVETANADINHFVVVAEVYSNMFKDGVANGTMKHSVSERIDVVDGVETYYSSIGKVEFYDGVNGAYGTTGVNASLETITVDGKVYYTLQDGVDGWTFSFGNTSEHTETSKTAQMVRVFVYDADGKLLNIVDGPSSADFEVPTVGAYSEKVGNTLAAITLADGWEWLAPETDIYEGGQIAFAKNGTQVAPVQITGEPVEAEKVTLNETELLIEKGQNFQLNASILPENTTNKNVTWESSDDNVAIVDEAGQVTGISAGNATITATVGNVKAECIITVYEVTATTPTVPEGSVEEVTVGLIADAAENAQSALNNIAEKVIAGDTSVNGIDDATMELINDTVENGGVIHFEVKAESLTEEPSDSENVKEAVLKLADKYNAEFTVGQYLDLGIDILANGEKIGELTTLDQPIEFTVAVPEEISKTATNYFIIRVHDGITSVIIPVLNDDGTLTFATDRFSTYALAYTSEDITPDEGNEWIDADTIEPSGTDDTKTPPKDDEGTVTPNTDVEKTADANDMLPWLALMAVMAIGVVLTAVKSKKREN